MIISIASGKGGTGKTTIATNLAFSLKADAVLLDCDVEAPNSHLFLNPKFEKTETVYTPVPEIDFEKCTLCGKCAEICRFNSIAVLPEKVLTFPELCHSCGGCFEVCPENAVSEAKRELGTIGSGYCGDIFFVNGRIRVGEAMAPPLIKKVKSYIDKRKINIIDAPPGTSCPVMTAMKNTDFVLLVTEPTPFGLHDLTLAVEAVKVLNIPCGLVINRADMGDSRVKDYAEDNNIPILMEIPFDRKIAEIYSRGELIVSAMPKFKEKFVELYHSIAEIVKRSKKGCAN
ncbi:MAG: ATP-binding protein [Deltaproteobacteria bacterium]|nr:ATP-binding protein [Deltaproteobacteria bacterium]